MEFSNKSYSASADFFIDALLKENKPIVTEKNEFDYRDKAILLEFFWVFQISGSGWKDLEKQLFNQTILYKCQIFIDTFTKNIKLKVLEKGLFKAR